MLARLLVSSSLNKIKEEINNTLASRLTSTNTNHPDLLYIKAGEKLGIAEAKKIKDHFSLKPYSAKSRVAILEDAAGMTIEAQNALLKTIEELPKEAILILGTTSDTNFLPTILSRCQITHLENPTSHQTPASEVGYIEDIKRLISFSIEERLKYIEKLKEKKEFLHTTTHFFHQHLLDYPRFTKELLQAEQWARQNVNIRAILEYLMLVMPQKM